MSTFTPVTELLNWTEGMMLAPQHFQQASLRSDALVQNRFRLLNAYCWGVHSLEFDMGALGKGVLSIESLTGILPDGLSIQYPSKIEGAGQKPIQLDLREHRPQLENSARLIYLVAAQQDPKATTSEAGDAGNNNARYDNVQELGVLDMALGNTPLDIDRLTPRLELSMNPAPGGAGFQMPIAKVRYAGERFRLVESYVPPPLVAPNQLIGECRDKVLDPLRAKFGELSRTLRTQTGMSRNETRMTLMSVTAALPLLEAILDAEGVRAHEIFLALAAVTGHLIPSMREPALPLDWAYDHLDVASCFQPLKDHIALTLQGMGYEHRTISFDPEGDSFQLILEPSFLNEKMLVAVHAQTMDAVDATAAWFEDSLIGTADRHGLIADRRVRGASRHRVTDDTRVKLGLSGATLVYEIKAEQDFIRPGKILVIRNPGEIDGVRRPSGIDLHLPQSTQSPP